MHIVYSLHKKSFLYINHQLFAPTFWMASSLQTDTVDFDFFFPIHPSHWGPEGGRSGTAEDTWGECKLQPTQQFQHHKAFSLCSSNDDRPFTCPWHQTHVAFSKTNDMSSLCWAHLLTLTLVLVFFPIHIYMESVVCLCSVLWGVSVPLFAIDIRQDQRGTWWLEHDWDVYFLLSYIVIKPGSHGHFFLLLENFIIRDKKEKREHFPSFFAVCSNNLKGVKMLIFPLTSWDHYYSQCLKTWRRGSSTDSLDCWRKVLFVELDPQVSSEERFLIAEMWVFAGRRL